MKLKLNFKLHVNKADDKKENKVGYTLKELMGTILVGYKGSNQLTISKSPNKTEIYDGDKLLGSIDSRNNVFWDDVIYSTYKNKIKTPEGKQTFDNASEAQFVVEETDLTNEEIQAESNRQRGITADKVRKLFVEKYGDKTINLQGNEQINKDIFLELIKTTFGRAFNKYGEQLAKWSLDGTISDERIDEKQRFIAALGLLVQDHNEEYDATFNGLTPQEIIRTFSGEVKEASRKDRQLSESVEEKDTGYTIVKIDSKQEAEKYYKDIAIDGTDSSSRWCITRGSYNSYIDKDDPAKGELFYFMLKDGYDTYKEIPEPGPNAPKDEFGLSMIAVSVKQDGSLNTATTRWNHTKGGSDNSFTVSELSELAGKSFFRAFPPITTPEERIKKIVKQLTIMKRTPVNSIGLYNSKLYIQLKDKQLLLDDYGLPYQAINWSKLRNKETEKLEAIILVFPGNEYMALTPDTLEILVDITVSEDIESFKQIVKNAL